MFVYIVIIAALVALELFAIVDAVRTPAATWTASGRNKTAWVIALVVISFGASVVYLAMVRPRLRDTQAQEAQQRTVRAGRAQELVGGVATCRSCGFSSNPSGAVTCRSCGSSMETMLR